MFYDYILFAGVFYAIRAEVSLLWIEQLLSKINTIYMICFEGMLEEYETDYYAGMNIPARARMLYDYTSVSPFLVSRLCKLIDETVVGTEKYPDRHAAWTREEFQEAVRLLLAESNTLFEDMHKKLSDYPSLRRMLYELLY